MDGIMAISQRMASISAQLGEVASTPVISGTSGDIRTSGSAAAFSAALDDAVAGTAGAGTVATTTDNVPDDLARYGNGRIPTAALAEVGTTGQRLWAPAATAMDQLMAAASRDGVQIGITDSYRSYDAQVDVAQRKGLYTQGGLAAAPGTSEHGWGMAVDLKLDASAQTWMQANADRFGFVANTPREPWHWAYRTS